MTCGWLPSAANPANRKCPISAGSTIGVQWHHNSDAPTDDILDASHKGPIQYYLALSESGEGNVWFKIFEDGYDASTGLWATDRMIANDGQMNITIPSDIAPGNYLLRGEVLALHNAGVEFGVQPYVGCIELAISGPGSTNPPGVAFPGEYSPTSPSLIFDIYNPYTSYIIPGPALYVSGSLLPTAPTSAPPTAAPTAAPTATPTSTPTSTPTTPPTAPTPAPTSAPLPISTPTYAPTSAPTNAPTTAPTSAPTVAPTNAPTVAPTNAPTVAPTTPPFAGATIKVQLNGGSSAWWLGVIVNGGEDTIVKVEIMDSGSVSAWTALVDLSYAYVFNAGVQLVLPISLRVTSSTGKQVTLTNFFTSYASILIDTGMTFSTTPTGAPTSAPPTPAPPTSAPPTAPATSAPTTPAPSPSGSTTEVTILSGVSEWWFAVTVSGNSEAITSVALQDAGSLPSFVSMTAYTWGYAYSTQGMPLEVPLTVLVTSASGASVMATIDTITSALVVATNGSL